MLRALSSGMSRLGRLVEKQNGTNANSCYWDTTLNRSSRKLLLPLHSNPNDFKSADRLTTMHQALLFCSLKSWPSMGTLPVEAYVSFAQSVLEALPSSSSQSATQSPNVAIFGEYFVDIVWSLDVELEELLSDAKTATGEAAAKALKVVQLAEEDKATLAHLVKRFSVSPCSFDLMLLCLILLRNLVCWTHHFAASALILGCWRVLDSYLQRAYWTRKRSELGRLCCALMLSLLLGFHADCPKLQTKQVQPLARTVGRLYKAHRGAD